MTPIKANRGRWLTEDWNAKNVCLYYLQIHTVMWKTDYLLSIYIKCLNWETLGQGHLLLIYKYQWTEETSCWNIGRGILFWYTILAAQQSQFFHFCIMIHQMFSNWWKVWTAGGQAGYPGSSTMKSSCCYRCSMQFIIYLLNYAVP